MYIKSLDLKQKNQSFKAKMWAWKAQDRSDACAEYIILK